MASGDLYEVERIVDKRKNKKGKWEYLIRWKGYGSKEDTWEPEHHLLHCEEFIDQFNSLHLHADRRAKPAAKPSGGSPRHLSRPGGPEHARGRGDHRKKKRTPVTAAGGATAGVGVGLGAVGGAGLDSQQHKPKKVSASKSTGDRVTKTMTYKSVPGGLQFVPSPRSLNGLQNGDEDPLHYRTNARAHAVPGERMERMLGDMDLSGAPPHMNTLGTTLTNGGLNLHSSVKRKLTEDKGYVFDKRLRYNVRQNDNNCRFRDIVVRKEEGFTHVLLSSQTSDHNALTPEIMKEMCRALGNAAADDSKLLLLSAVGSIFCSGLDPSYLIGRLSTDRRKESSRIADAVR